MGRPEWISARQNETSSVLEVLSGMRRHAIRLGAGCRRMPPAAGFDPDRKSSHYGPARKAGLAEANTYSNEGLARALSSYNKSHSRGFTSFAYLIKTYLRRLMFNLFRSEMIRRICNNILKLNRSPTLSFDAVRGKSNFLEDLWLQYSPQSFHRIPEGASPNIRWTAMFLFRYAKPRRHFPRLSKCKYPERNGWGNCRGYWNTRVTAFGS